MIRQLSTSALIAAFAVMMAEPAQAAKLEILQDPLKANYGNGYVGVSNGAQLQTGDKAMAQQGGSGQIVYDDGCAVPVEAGKVVVVQAQSPCVGAAGGDYAVPAGIGDWAMWTLPGAAVIGGLVFLFNDDDSGVDVAASP
jgi:hypothetical protein